ncbi:MAG: trypsin-like serine protease [Chitinivibrionales bacterium]|nr:trypsin-like serine protease [Chitinivibrionales bacterium]
MRTHNAGTVALYLLILTSGLILGAIFGGTFIRRIYRRPFVEASATQDGDRPSQAVPRSAPGRVFPKDKKLATTRQNAIVTATREVAPCVVGIVVTQLQYSRKRMRYYDLWDYFFAPEIVPNLREVEKLGSGIVISSDGLILTNNHVVEGARTLFVNFSDGSEMQGKITGVDPQTDLALIKVDGKNLKHVELTTPEHLYIGEWAIAIGNPFGYFINDVHPTVTVGVVSAIERNFPPNEGVFYQRMIQTDAAINPGNSGGPLVNALGQVIGINAFIHTGSKQSKGSVGIGFAIPVNRARRVMEELAGYGRRRPVWTGLVLQNMNIQLAQTLGYDKLTGMVVTSVMQNSPAESAGLQAGDIITQLGRRKINSSADLEGFLVDYFAGDSFKIVYVRKGQTRSARLKLSEHPGKR